jgi:hypothetical protein
MFSLKFIRKADYSVNTKTITHKLLKIPRFANDADLSASVNVSRRSFASLRMTVLLRGIREEVVIRK